MLQARRNFLSYYLIAIFVLFYASYQAYLWRWICDDAYISFVYARNFWDGFGLVYNIGERVEGYTNFLWTVYLSLAYGLGLKPQLVSVTTGIFFYLLLLFVFFREENKLSLGNFYPLLIVHLALFFHLHLFASSGLETSLFTFLVSIGCLHWEKRKGSVFYIFLLAALVRPEGALFLCIASLDWFKQKRFLLPIVFGILFSCFLLLRYWYYQDFFPNTFYAKGNKGSYLSQGLYYFLYLIRSYPLYPIVFLLAGIQMFKSVFVEKEHQFLVISLLFYFIYVFYVGGDFMGNRFWVPILPFLSYFAFKRLLLWTNESQYESNQNKVFYRLYAKNSILFSLLFILAAAIHVDPLKLNGTRIADWHGIVEERMFYDKHLIDVTGYDEGALQNFRVTFFGAQAHFIYYLKPSFAFEAESGLTDRDYAKKRVVVRGRIGHETELQYEDLNLRQIDLLLDNRLPELNLPFITYTWRNVPIRFYVWKYEPKKFNPLCQRKDWNCNELEKRFLSDGLDWKRTAFFGKNNLK